MGMDGFDHLNRRNRRARFKDMGEHEMVGPGVAMAEHSVIQEKGRHRVGSRRVGSDHCSVEIDIGGTEMVEDKAGIVEVCQGEGAESDELESKEVGLAMAKSKEEGLNLFEMAEVFAFLEQR